MGNIEDILFQNLEKNNFVNNFKNINNLNQFFEIYITIEKIRLDILQTQSIDYNTLYFLRKICKKRLKYLSKIEKNWDYYKNFIK